MVGLCSGSTAFKIKYQLNAVRSNKKANSYSLINTCFFFIVDLFRYELIVWLSKYPASNSPAVRSTRTYRLLILASCSCRHSAIRRYSCINCEQCTYTNSPEQKRQKEGRQRKRTILGSWARYVDRNWFSFTHPFILKIGNYLIVPC